MPKRPTIASLTAELNDLSAKYQECQKMYSRRDSEYYTLAKQLEQMKDDLAKAKKDHNYAELAQNELHGQVLGMNSVLDRFAPKPVCETKVLNDTHETTRREPTPNLSPNQMSSMLNPSGRY